MTQTQQKNSVNNSLIPTSQPSAIIKVSFLGQIAKEIGRVEDEIISELPAMPDNATDADDALRRAEVAHLALIRLGHLEKITSAARRYQLWQSYNMELWRNVRVPLTHPNGEPTGNYHAFEDFESYFLYIVEAWGIRAPSSISILRNGATILLPAAHAGLIVSSAGDNYSVEDILTLDEAAQQLLIGVANRALNPQPGREAAPVETIGQAAEIIMSSADHESAVVGLKNAGLITGKGDFEKIEFYTYDSGEEVYIAAKLTPAQYRILLMALRMKAETRSSTLEHLQLFFEDNGEPNEPENYGASLVGQATRLIDSNDGR